MILKCNDVQYICFIFWERFGYNWHQNGRLWLVFIVNIWPIPSWNPHHHCLKVADSHPWFVPGLRYTGEQTKGACILPKVFVNSVIISFIENTFFDDINTSITTQFSTSPPSGRDLLHLYIFLSKSWYHDIMNTSNLPRSARWTWWRERSFVFSSSRTRPLFRYSCLADFWWPFNWHCSDGHND